MDSLVLPTDIPNDGQKFYEGFDPFVNEDTGEMVEQLAAHQIEIWNDRWKYIYREYPKSQKIAVSTLCLLEDAHHALTDCMGREIYIVAQSKDHAKVHLQDFRKMILSSRYHDYLITKPMQSIGLLKDEVTKTDEAYMHNPLNPFRPTHIYAKGFESGQLISHKRVKHIHASDIEKSKLTALKKKEAFGAMMSRLANTGGSCVIESIFAGVGGPMYDQYEKYIEYLKAKETPLHKLSRRQQQAKPFYCRKLKYTVGVDAGIISPEFIEGERIRLGPLFPMFYEAEAIDSESTWYFEEDIIQSEDASLFFAGLGSA
jgi:hypothetical protein